jgi:hypothetical protein
MLFQKVLLGLDLELLHRQLERHPRERLDLGGHILPHLCHLGEEIFKLELFGLILLAQHADLLIKGINFVSPCPLFIHILPAFRSM